MELQLIASLQKLLRNTQFLSVSKKKMQKTQLEIHIIHCASSSLAGYFILMSLFAALHLYSAAIMAAKMKPLR